MRQLPLAAQDYVSGKVFAQTATRHRHQEWLAILRKIDREIAPELELRILCDNSSIPRARQGHSLAQASPPFSHHFVPTSSSWLNLLERFFGEITAKVIRPGSLRSVGALVTDILCLSRSSQSQPQTPTPGLRNPNAFLKNSIPARGDIQSGLWDITPGSKDGVA